MKYTPESKVPFDVPRTKVDLQVGDTVRIMTTKSTTSAKCIGTVAKILKVMSDMVSLEMPKDLSPTGRGEFYRTSVLRIRHADGSPDYGSSGSPKAQAAHQDDPKNNVYLKAYRLGPTGLEDKPTYFVSTNNWIASCDGWLTSDGADFWYITNVYAYTDTTVLSRRLFGSRNFSDLSASQRAIAHRSIEERRLYTIWFPKPALGGPSGAGTPLKDRMSEFVRYEPAGVESADLELNPPIEIKTVDQINGVEFSRFTDDAIFDIIRDLETQWDHLSKVRAKPKALKNRMNEINATVDQLVALLDARTDAAATQ